MAKPVKVVLDDDAWRAALDPALDWRTLLPGARFAVEDAPDRETDHRHELACTMIEAEELAEYFHKAVDHFSATRDSRADTCARAQRAIRDAIARASSRR